MYTFHLKSIIVKYDEERIYGHRYASLRPRKRSSEKYTGLGT